MKSMNKRLALIAGIGTVALAAALTACGGGGGSTTTPAQVATSPAAPTVVASMNPIQVVSNVAGPTGKLTLSLKIPKLTAPSAALKARVVARYGKKIGDSRIRMMSTTSPSAQIRAAGMQQNRYAASLEKTGRRSPAFISPGSPNNTYEYVELVLTSGGSTVYDGTVGCFSGQCNAEFDSVPVGGPYTLSAFLYDYCSFLLGAGTTTNVSVQQGENQPVTVTLNGIVAYLDVTSTATLINDPSNASNFTENVTPLDADQNIITSPGVLLDENFNQITGVSLTLNPPNPPATPYPDVSPIAAQTLSVNPDLTIPAATFNYAGTGTELEIDTIAAPITSGQPVVPAVLTGVYGGYSSPSPASGSGAVVITIPPLMWTALQSPYLFTPLTTTGQSTSYAAEFSGPTAGNYEFGLQESAAAFSGTISLTDNGNCGSVSSYNPALGTQTSYTAFPTPAPSGSPGVQIQMTLNNNQTQSSCVITATDSAANPRTSTLNLYVDKSSLTIQGKARSSK